MTNQKQYETIQLIVDSVVDRPSVEVFVTILESAGADKSDCLKILATVPGMETVASRIASGEDIGTEERFEAARFLPAAKKFLGV